MVQRLLEGLKGSRVGLGLGHVAFIWGVIPRPTKQAARCAYVRTNWQTAMAGRVVHMWALIACCVFRERAEGHQVRHVVIEGAPWFVAIDVCRILGMNVRAGVFSHVRHLRPLEKWVLTKKEALAHPVLRTGSVSVLFPGLVCASTLISESGLYKLIMRSDKPIASVFQDWVTQEVLPSIRKTGSYSLGHMGAVDALPSPQACIRP